MNCLCMNALCNVHAIEEQIMQEKYRFSLGKWYILLWQMCCKLILRDKNTQPIFILATSDTIRTPGALENSS